MLKAHMYIFWNFFGKYYHLQKLPVIFFPLKCQSMLIFTKFKLVKLNFKFYIEIKYRS